MNVAQLDADTLQVHGQLVLGSGRTIPRSVKFDRTNAGWVAALARAFAAGQPVAAACAQGPDQLTAKVGGTDQEPSLILQNTRADGGTLYLSEAEALALSGALAG